MVDSKSLMLLSKTNDSPNKSTNGSLKKEKSRFPDLYITISSGIGGGDWRITGLPPVTS